MLLPSSLASLRAPCTAKMVGASSGVNIWLSYDLKRAGLAGRLRWTAKLFISDVFMEEEYKYYYIAWR